MLLSKGITISASDHVDTTKKRQESRKYNNKYVELWMSDFIQQMSYFQSETWRDST